MFRFIIFTLFLLPKISQAQEWKSFSDSSILFTAKYPTNWINKIKEEKRVFFTSFKENAKDDFLENVNLSVTTNPEYGVKYKIADLLPAVIENLKASLNDFKTEGQSFFKWNDVDAVELIYSGYSKSNEKLNVRIIQWFCFYKTRLYTATFTSKAESNIFTATARKIMNSIVFTN